MNITYVAENLYHITLYIKYMFGWTGIKFTNIISTPQSFQSVLSNLSVHNVFVSANSPTVYFLLYPRH
jgi:hypothetical protein